MSDAAPIVVLNVDDQEAQRYVKSRDLELAGFSVIEAPSGAEALRLVEAKRPAVVLLDVQLPDISGHDVCAYIKTKWPEVMVLQTSATFVSPPDRAHGLESGADSYLVQPADPLELRAAINALLRIRKSEDALRQANATLEQRVQERIAELAEANTRLKLEIEQRHKAEEALLQAQKMEAVGQLTGGLAHDFNNLLTAVVGNLDLIRARASDPRLVRLAENAYKAAERGSKLTAQLLAFSRTQKLATTPVDINGLISGMAELLHQSLGGTIRVETHFVGEAAVALADPNQLELVILNLSINARDAMPQGGTLTITTDIDPSNPRRIRIGVSDTGTGMPPEVLSRAFDPFFTTKPPGKGTGLGLSQVYGVIRQMGGEIMIDTEVGKGTSVRLMLNRTDASIALQHSVEDRSLRGRAEKLLIVDDDADVRAVMAEVLTEVGYVIHQSPHAAAALALLDTDEVDLLVVDFAMPGLNGAEFAQAARVKKPELPILFVSGFSDSAALENAVENAPFLRKPFRPFELAAAVRAALDG